MAWKIGYYIFMETAVLVYNLVQRLHRLPERNRCVLTLFSPWKTPDGGYSLQQLLKKHLLTIFILDFILFSKNCVLNTVSFRLKKHSFLLFMRKSLCSSCLTLHKPSLLSHKQSEIEIVTLWNGEGGRINRPVFCM